MISSRQLSEAYAGERRRLVSAFVHGSSGALDLEPARDGRAIVTGLLLAGLLAGGGAVLRVAALDPPETTTPAPPAGRAADGTDAMLAGGG